MVNARLGAVEKLNARDFTVSELCAADRATFFNANHIDGDVRAHAAFCLKHGDTIVAEHTWQGHRELSNNLLSTIQQQLTKHHINWQDIDGLVVFRGPGSFTGLRIGITVANALSDSLSVPLVGEKGDDWIADGLARLADEKYDDIVLPFYGSPARITAQKK
jgi:tRNA threonylcarbamoyladenosine biosynthesis protein TsaB